MREREAIWGDCVVLIYQKPTGMSLADRIVTNPTVLGGKPVVRVTRLFVEFVRELPAAGEAESTILPNHPGLISEFREALPAIVACNALSS